MKKISLICIVALTASFFPQRIIAESMGEIYYVSPEGDDANDGSIDMPFRTISYAAGVMQAGDTCYIRGGVYRETVSVKNKGTKEKPIAFKPYNDETVTISGADVLDGSWQKYKGNIYYTKMDWSLDNANMIFADGVMQQEARWPNITDGLDSSQYAKPDAFSNGVITDADIPNVDMSNSLIWFRTNSGYWSFTGRVISNSAGKMNITYDAAYPPDNTSIYYAARNLNLLDSAGEWYLDEEADRLYFWAPGDVNPEKLEISAQKRKNAVEFSDARYVTFDGIEIMGANIEMSDNTENCTLNNISAKYLSYDVALPKSGSGSCNSRGIQLRGRHNTIKNSQIASTFGDAIEMSGSYNAVVNCDIHDFNYENTYSYGVNISGDHQLVKNNSIYRTGRSAIGGAFETSEISYNNIYDTMKISKDGGALYLVNHDFENSEIHHNVFSDQQNDGFGAAIYYDSGCSRLVTYNNAVICDDNSYYTLPLCVNNPSEYNLFFNNTFIGEQPVHFVGKTKGMAGSVYVNNVFTAEPFDENAAEDYGFSDMNNAVVERSELNADATLKNGSAAIDSGIYLPGIGENYSASAPDCGAYENGAVKWTAGYDKAKDVSAEIDLSEVIPFENVLDNGSFEKAMNGWTVQGGAPKIITQDAWSNPQYVRLGESSLELKRGDFVKKTVTGLVPNETYELQWYAKTAGSFIKATDYAEVSEPFVTAVASSDEILTNMKTGQWVKYSNVDFGDGEYDSVVYTNYHGSYVYNNMDMYIDGFEDLISSAKVYAIASWYEDTHKLTQRVTGVHDVYIKFSDVSASDVLFAGFALYDSTASDEAQIIAISDSGEQKESVACESEWGTAPQKTEITTGSVGEITIYLQKTKGANSVYFDCLGLAQKVTDNVSTPEVYIDNVRLKNMQNSSLSEWGKNELNIFETELVNPLKQDVVYNVEYICYNKDNSVFSKVEAICEMTAKGHKTVGLGTFSSGDGAYAKIRILKNDSVLAAYEITPVTLFNKNAETDKDLRIESAWISNDMGTQKIEANMPNILTLNVMNLSGAEISANCIAALYDENMRLVSVKSEPKVFCAYGSEQLKLNLGEKADNEMYAKIMVFKDKTIIPLTDLFKIY